MRLSTDGCPVIETGQEHIPVLFVSIHRWANSLVGTALPDCSIIVQVGKMCTVRDLLVMSRHGLIPGALAHINKYTGTPLRMILIYGVCCGGSLGC